MKKRATPDNKKPNTTTTKDSMHACHVTLYRNNSVSTHIQAGYHHQQPHALDARNQNKLYLTLSTHFHINFKMLPSPPPPPHPPSPPPTMVRLSNKTFPCTKWFMTFSYSPTLIMYMSSVEPTEKC